MKFPVIPVSSGLIIQNNKVLIGLRSENDNGGGLWEFPGGKIENIESSEEAVIRELKEETGLVPYRMFVADHVSSFYESNFDRMNMVPVFGIEVKSLDVILSEEHCEFRWTTFEKAYKILTWNGQKKGLKVVYEMLNSKDERIKWSKVSI